MEAALLAELPGILNWSLAGLERLTFTNKNRFTVVTAADEAVTAMRDLASPVGAFVREKCEIGADKKVEVDALYEPTKTGAKKTSTRSHRSRSLAATFAPWSSQFGSLSRALSLEFDSTSASRFGRAPMLPTPSSDVGPTMRFCPCIPCIGRGYARDARANLHCSLGRVAAAAAIVSLIPDSPALATSGEGDRAEPMR